MNIPWFTKYKPDRNIKILTQFIDSNPDPRELKITLAIRMSLAGDTYQKVESILGMSKARISFWKQRFKEEGIEGIRLHYKGQKGYLTPK